MPQNISLKIVSLLLICAFTQYSWAKPYTNYPTERFGKVHDGIYRGAYPKSLIEMKNLKKMGVKTILNLQADPKVIEVGRKQALEAGLKYISIPLDGFWAPKDWQANAVLAALDDPKNKPIYIHCTHGRERTGIMLALHRVESDGWSAKKAYAEAKAYGFRWVVYRMKDYFENRTGVDL